MLNDQCLPAIAGKQLRKIDKILIIELAVIKIMPRLSLDVDEQFSQKLDQLVQLTGASSQADVFRQALSFYLDTKTKDILNQIDIAQARIIKDQEEIQSLADETDELLNLLQSKVS